MIVGHKIETYLTAWPNMFNRLIVTKHTVIIELHATKGWRTVRHDRKEQVRTRRPWAREWRLNNVTTFKRFAGQSRSRLQVRP